MRSATTTPRHERVKVGDVALKPSVIYPFDGNVVGKTYIAALPDELLPNWRSFSVCGHPHFPAFFIFDPTAIVHGTSCIIPFPRTVHVGSYLR